MSKSRPEMDAESSDDEVPVSRKEIEQFKNDVTVTQLEDWGNAGEEGLITEAKEWYDRIVSTFGKNVFTKQERSRLKTAFTKNTFLALEKKLAKKTKELAESAKGRKALEEKLAETAKELDETAKGRKALEEELNETAKGRKALEEELAHAKEFANKEKISVLISQPCIERTIRNVSYSNTSRVPHVRSVSRKEIDGDFLIPINVKEWVTFAVDAKLTLLPLGDDILVGPDSWPIKTEFDCGMNESTSQADMSGSMLQPIEKYHELDPRSPNIMKFQEEGHWLGGRVDISWTRKIRDSDTSKLLMLSSFHEMNVAAENIVFLVHEHKAPKAFPFVPEPGAEFTVNRKTGKKIPAKYGHRHRSRSQRTSQGSVSSSQSSQSLPEMMEEDNRLKQEVDLVAIWDRFEKCKRSDYFFKFVAPICQLFTYMVSTGLKFGILSTFDKTWFCRRDKRGCMEISQAFDACVGRGIHATRRAYLGIITLALKDVEATGYGLVKGKRTLYEAMKNHTNDTFKKFADTLADGKKDLDSDISRTFADKFAYFCKEKFNGGLQDSTRQNAIDAVREVLPLSDKDFYLPLDGETLHRNSRTIVHRCSLSGAPMIVKRWVYSLLPRRPDDNDAAKLGLQNERWAYEVKLASLQGIAIPFLIYAGRYATMPFVLAVSDEGESLERLLMAAADNEERATLLDTYFDEAHEALAAIHSCGVLHNDIAARNIVIHPERGVKIIDFESASEYCEDLLAQEEMREFFAIFNRTVTGTPRKTGKKIWRRLSLALPNYPRNLRESKPPMDGTQDNDGKKRRILSFLPGGLSPSRASDSSSPSSE